MITSRFAATRSFSVLVALTVGLTAGLTVGNMSQAEAATKGEAFLLTKTQIFRTEQANVEVPEDSMITVLENRFNVQGDEYLHLGIDSDVESVPAELWVRATEFATSVVEPLGAGVDVDQALDDVMSSMGKKMTYCYRYVKLYLLKKGLVRSYLPGTSAWQAKNYLPGQGFHRTGKGPGSSRVNDVCVYSGGNGNNGHIEVKTSGGWYYGYGNKSSPISLNNHRLIGCYSKH